MRKYHAVIFDIDGCLLDSVDLHAEAWREVFESHGRAIPFEQIRAQVGKGGDQLLPVFFSNEEVAHLGKEMEVARGKLFQEKMLANVRPFPGVRALFERLRADGFRIGLASSARADEVAIYEAIIGIQDLVDVRTSTDDASKSKPHPDIFQAALEKLGNVPADTVLAVGDTPYDIEAAGKIGIRGIGMRGGGFPEDDLRRAGALAVYADPADLLARYEDSPFTTLTR